LRLTEAAFKLGLGSSRMLVRLFFATLLLAGGQVVFKVAPVRGEMILDDFDDPVEVISPAMDDTPVTTLSVGPLIASRTVEIFSGSTNPAARFDANVTHPSRLSASLTALNRLNTLSAIVVFEFDYAFASTDVSEGGGNNAILFDLHSINGSRLPTFLRALVHDASGATYESRISSLPLNSGPFTLAMPFSSFTLRGGEPGAPDFSTMDRMDFDFFFLGGDDPVQWSMQMDRIRIGRIPEPSTGSLAFIGVALVASAARSGRRNSQRKGVSDECVDLPGWSAHVSNSFGAFDVLVGDCCRY
jgi:hypothetical protein